MGLLDWLRDGLLGERARLRHVDRNMRSDGERESADPSGPHDFGRRAHRPDPQGHYGFGTQTREPDRL